MLGISFGTRPEWLKVKPVIKELNRKAVPFVLICTGQHKELLDLEEISNIGAHKFVDYKMENTKNDDRLNSVVSEITKTAPGLNDISALMVQGDTTSAFAMALAAFHRHIPVIHLEAGLRTYDVSQPFPEEANRQMISSLASLHLCPTQTAKQNLLNENVSGKVKVVGNTSLDNLVHLLDKIDYHKREETKKVIITLHRRENHENILEWFKALSEIAYYGVKDDFSFDFYAHPNPNVKNNLRFLDCINIRNPIPHEKMAQKMVNTSLVITDSGGLQEEAAFFNVPCIVCREKTERIEGLDNFSILATNPVYLKECARDFISAFDFINSTTFPMEGPCPYGDGKSAKRVVKQIKKFMDKKNGY